MAYGIQTIQVVSWATWVAVLAAGGCSGKDGGVAGDGGDSEAASTGEGGAGATDGATGGDTEPGSETGGCEGGCAQEFACIDAVVWNGGLIGMGHRTIGDCEDCGADETSQVVLVQIDPVSEARTVFAEGQIKSRGDVMVGAGDGSLVVGGYVNEVDGESGAGLLHKFSAAGELVWTVTSGVGPIVDLAVRGDELLVLDQRRELLGLALTDGATLWEIAGEGDSREVEVDGEGAIYVAGEVDFIDDALVPAWYLRKYAADRTLVWEQMREPQVAMGRPNIQGLALDEAGGVVVAVHDGGLKIRKFDGEGTELWSASPHEALPGAQQPYTWQLIARPGGGVIAVGDVPDGGGAFGLALGPDGATLWSEVHLVDGLRGETNRAAVIGDGQVRVVGCGQLDSGLGSLGWLLSRAP